MEISDLVSGAHTCRTNFFIDALAPVLDRTGTFDSSGNVAVTAIEIRQSRRRTDSEQEDVQR
jgi:hypothetical protein